MLNEATQQFLGALWQYKPDDHYFLVWSKRDDTKRSYWCREVADAAVAGEAGRHSDLYVGCSLSAVARGVDQRVGNDDAAGIAGLWVDIDILSEVHQAKALPPTAELALEILPDGVPPTLLVRSGNGLHAWWLFKEPWVFEGPEEREEAAKLLRRWQALLRMKAASRGWSLDHTHDLARVLRLPGTLNHKTNPPRMVSLLKNDGPRYNAGDFDEILDQHKIPRDFQAARRAAMVGTSTAELVLAPDASVDERMLELLLDASPKFKATWLRARWDLNNGDPSQSHYDLAIANFGLDAGLPEQLIVNLMIQHRRGNPDQKARRKLREDYYRRTLDIAYQKGAGALPVPILPEPVPPAWIEAAAPEAAKMVAEAAGPPAETETVADSAPAQPAAPADPFDGIEAILAAELRAAEVREAAEALAPPAAAPAAPSAPSSGAKAPQPTSAKPKAAAGSGAASPPIPPADDASRALMCDYLSELLGVRILRIVKIRGKEPSYHMELDSGKVEFPRVEKLIDQQQVRLAIAAHSNQLIRRFRTKEWDQVVTNILSALTEVEGGMELEFEGAIRTYLHAYLQQANFVDPGEENPTFLLRPMIVGHAIAIAVHDLLLWLGRTLQLRVSAKEVTSALVAIGAKPYDITTAKLRQSRWKLPVHDWRIDDYESAKVNLQRRVEMSASA
jgi:hypothetical protein